MSGAMAGWQSQCWDLHGLAILGRWDAAALGERWQAAFASLPKLDGLVPHPPELDFRLQMAARVPAAPSSPPDFQEGSLLAYYLDASARAAPSTGASDAGQIVAHFPRFGQLRHDLATGRTEGILVTAALDTYGVFEDLLAIGLSPHLRRRGMFLLHAFAAAEPASPGGRAVLIVGDIGAGKTTTGLALLHAGWKLLSNDSPILAAHGELRVLSYPGLLSAYPDSLACFPELASVAPAPAAIRTKALFAAEAVYPQVWVDSAPPGAVVLPAIEARRDHSLERLPAPEALRLILPHAIEQWDRALIPQHLALLNQLVQTVPAYRLRLARDTMTLPGLLASALQA